MLASNCSERVASAIDRTATLPNRRGFESVVVAVATAVAESLLFPSASIERWISIAIGSCSL
jgi:hypothetical protein